MKKYPKRNERCYYATDPGRENVEPGVLFREGSAMMHAKYLVEMEARHPIMYWCWYRWWISFLLQPNERKYLAGWMKYYRQYKFSPYWADFALYHPVQFLVFLFLFTYTMQPIIKVGMKLFLTAIQVIGGVLGFDFSKNSVDNWLSARKE